MITSTTPLLGEITRSPWPRVSRTPTSPTSGAGAGQRIPAHAQHQVRLEHQIHGRTVTIVKHRAPWDPDDSSEWTSRPVAQLRHSAHGWRLHWADPNSRWHLIHDVPTAADVTPLLKVIDDPGQPPFLG